MWRRLYLNDCFGGIQRMYQNARQQTRNRRRGHRCWQTLQVIRQPRVPQTQLRGGCGLHLSTADTQLGYEDGMECTTAEARASGSHGPCRLVEDFPLSYACVIFAGISYMHIHTNKQKSKREDWRVSSSAAPLFLHFVPSLTLLRTL